MKRLSEIEITRQLAEHTAKRVTRKVIATLQGFTEFKLSGDDSTLGNTWDEVCVQVQGEESYAWGVYKETMQTMLNCEITKLAPFECEALWLQTKQGSDWDCEKPDDREAYPVCNNDIVDYLLRDHVLEAAGRWTNRRIRAYLDRSSSRD